MPSRPAVFRAALPLFLLAAGKLWLVSGEEIVAVAGRFDQALYARSAAALLDGAWLGRYDELTLVRPCGYPLWLALAAASGVPQRIAVELLLALAAALLATGLRRTGVSPRAAVLAFAAVVFSPLSLDVNNQLLADALYTPLLLATIAACLHLLAARPPRPWHGLLIALPLGAAWHTRPEFALLLALLGAAAAAHLIVLRRMGAPQALRRSLVAPAVALLGPLLAGILIAGANRGHYGVFTTHELVSAPQRRAMVSLLRVRAQTLPPYAALPRDERRLVYAASPTFASLRPHLEGDLLEAWTDPRCTTTGQRREYEHGAFVFGLREAGARLGHFRTASTARAFLGRLREEIDGACEAGSLSCRPRWLAAWHPHLTSALPRLPSSLLTAARLALGAPASIGAQQFSGVDRETRATFDRVARRRAGHLDCGPLEVAGWAVVSGEPPARVEVRGDGDRVLAQTEHFHARPDVVEALSRAGCPPASSQVGFHVVEPSRPFAPAPRVLVLRSSRGQETRLSLAAGGILRCSIPHWIELVQEPQGCPVVRRGLQWIIARAYPGLLAMALLAGLVAAALPARRVRLASLSPVALSAILLLAFAALSRLVFFGSVDAALFRISERYLYPVAPLLACATATWLDAILRRPEAGD